MPAGRREGPDLLLDVRVQPRASRSEIAGRHGVQLRIRLQAPPVDGRANAALVAFIAREFGLPRAQVAWRSMIWRWRTGSSANWPPWAVV